VSSFITALTMGMGLGAYVNGIAWLFVNAMGREMRGARNFA
jgi:hypothetical protein